LAGWIATACAPLRDDAALLYVGLLSFFLTSVIAHDARLSDETHPLGLPARLALRSRVLVPLAVLLVIYVAIDRVKWGMIR
jgi:hypothetical protein